MHPPESRGSGAEIDDPRLHSLRRRFRRSKATDAGDGNYQRNADRVISEWIDFIRAGGKDDHHPFIRCSKAKRVSELERDHYAAYAEHLADRVHRDEIAGSTARTYFNYVSAFTEWLVRRDYCSDNYARKEVVTETLPSRTPRRSQQQFWGDEERAQLESYLSELVHEAVEADGRDALQPLRNRALAMTLMYSGGRGGELLRDPHDSRRRGVRWSDVDLEAGVIRTLGKSQEPEEVSLPPQARPSIERLQQALEPEDTWPVFPTFSPPALARHLRQTVGLEDDRLDELRDDHEGWIEIYRAIDEPLPALTTEGGRNVMRDLSEGAEIDTDVHDYLAPHGGRRGVGDKAYRVNPARAQQMLRHKSIETTQDAYSHIDAAETAEWAGELFDGEADR